METTTGRHDETSKKIRLLISGQVWLKTLPSLSPDGVSSKPAILCERLDKTCGSFFPRVPPGFACPRPLSVEFWRLYGEPLSQFLQAAETLRNILIVLAQNEVGDEVRGRALSVLDCLSESTSVSPKPTKPGSIKKAWSSPSLVSAFATMIILDLSDGLKFYACQECKAPFLSRRDRRFCTTVCRNTGLKREQRERERSRGE